MTIRDYIQRRGKMARYVGFAYIVVLMIAAFTLFPALMSDNGTLWMVVAMLPLVAVYYVIGQLTKCPRCQTSLYLMAMQTANPFGGEIPNFCPHCGVSLDEPMS
jgi:hypothetical protein